MVQQLIHYMQTVLWVSITVCNQMQTQHAILNSIRLILFAGQITVNSIASQNVRLNSADSVTSLISGGNTAMFQQQQISNSSNVSIAEEALSIGDVADLLHPQYAIITGGRSREGCPIITFPDHNNFHLLTEHDYEKLISYLTSVPT